MPHRCDAICQSGTEEQCAACLASQFGGAAAKARDKGFITAEECDGLCAVFDGLMMRRVPSAANGAAKAAADNPDLAGTSDPKGGAT